MYGPNLIIESTIFSEAEIVKSNPSKAVFRCPIQTVDEVNQNHRIYPKTVLKEGMDNCRPVSYTHLTLPTIYSV